MPEITLDGTFCHGGIGADAVVILSVFDEKPFEDWCQANAVFSQIVRHKDPASGNERPAIYVTEEAASGIREGTAVRITIDIRPEKRGNGLQILEITVATG